MKPLSKNDINSFLKRFGSFIDAELRSIEILAPTAIKITFTAQDAARGFDWIIIELEFKGVSDAKVVENSKLPHIDMSNGITLLFMDNTFTFALGAYNTPLAATNSICYIKATSLKYKEGSF
ncbi:MAG: hypothetical protein PHX44_02840 [Sulfurimonas sp.]|uniref:hypothetical protein n=1 Tax=Sulfurimonas sp. TaxID=2022749 RepID=UPI0026378DAF|nr:hypothetical protein [Sulfurimonas sp.]MDD2651974.1 hypothetical protein [Sulfurimonas sp.]MDD3451900.1 hypothetical protein [Sulfurimonas sp.]